MTVLDAAEIQGAHPELPAGWRRDMGMIQAEGGPWSCSSCGGASLLVYRCSRCGNDIA